MTRFDQFTLSQHTLNAIAKMGYTEPTPIQASTIPALLEGRDVLAQARTGTGKTAAFGIPMVEGAAQLGEPGVVGLVLVPTRELALQVSQELEKIAHGTRVAAVAVYGGVGIQPQVKALRQRAPMLVVATPGRLLDHLGQRTIDLSPVRMLVLDEADRMLDMGFLPDVRRILERLPKDRQTALLSATLPREVLQIAERFMHDPASFRAEGGPATVSTVEQFRVVVDGGHKKAALFELLKQEAPTRVLVFTRTKHRARSLARDLQRRGTAAVALQGNMSQSQRERALEQFRESHATILVATDVASRGLDVPDVSHVINFDMPAEADAYVHRVGRTARMGRAGRAFTFVQPDQERDWRRLAADTGATVSDVRLQLDPEALAAAATPRQAPHGEPRQARRGPPRGGPRRGRGGGPQRSGGSRRDHRGLERPPRDAPQGSAAWAT